MRLTRLTFLLTLYLHATDPQDWAAPRAFATTWTHMRGVYFNDRQQNKDAWDSALDRARKIGFHGIVAVINADNLRTSPDTLAKTCKDYLDICQKHQMACVFSFNALERPDTQPCLWSRGENAYSLRLNAVAKETAQHPALAGYILCQEPELKANNITESTYLKSIFTLTHTIRAYNPELPIIIKGNEADADSIPDIPSITRPFDHKASTSKLSRKNTQRQNIPAAIKEEPSPNNAPSKIALACHLFEGNITKSQMDKHFSCRDKNTPIFVSDIALSKRDEKSVATRSAFFCRALEKIIGYGWSAGVFGFDGDNTDARFTLAQNESDRLWGYTECLAGIAQTLKKLRDSGALAPPTYIPT